MGKLGGLLSWHQFLYLEGASGVDVQSTRLVNKNEQGHAPHYSAHTEVGKAAQPPPVASSLRLGEGFLVISPLAGERLTWGDHRAPAWTWRHPGWPSPLQSPDHDVREMVTAPCDPQRSGPGGGGAGTKSEMCLYCGWSFHKRNPEPSSGG